MNLRESIMAIECPERWVKDGVAQPTEEAKEKSVRIAELIYGEFNLEPERVCATVEEGVFLSYYDKSSKKQMCIEVYNDLDVGVIIDCKKEMLANAIICNDVELRGIVSYFKGE